MLNYLESLQTVVDIDKLVAKLFPKFSIVSTLKGSYEGTCDGIPTEVQLETAKWDSEETDSPLLGYKLRGRWGVLDKSTCGDIGRFCRTDRFSSGYYNFYTGQLILEGRPKSREGTVEGNSLVFEECKLTKNKKAQPDSVDGSTDRKAFERGYHLEVSKDPLPLDPVTKLPKIEDIEGEYEGYLHHEFLDRYQFLRLNLRAYFLQTIPHQEFLHLSATSWLYFGDSTSKEFIASKYHERQYRESVPYFTFEGRYRNYWSDSRDGLVKFYDGPREEDTIAIGRDYADQRQPLFPFGRYDCRSSLC